MLVIGLTGGIGSGKSEVSRRFEALGVPVVDTDVISRELVAPGSPGVAEIARGIGSEFVGADGRLDRRRLREAVFSDDSIRMRLEDILHPRIRERVERTLGALEAPFAVVVIPLLMESRYPIHVDRVLVVDAPVDLQVERIRRRDNVDEQGARRIIGRQVPRSERLAAADDVIVNDGDIGALDARVRQLCEQYLAASG